MTWDDALGPGEAPGPAGPSEPQGWGGARLGDGPAGEEGRTNPAPCRCSYRLLGHQKPVLFHSIGDLLFPVCLLCPVYRLFIGKYSFQIDVPFFSSTRQRINVLSKAEVAIQS